MSHVTYSVNSLKPLRDKVLVRDMIFTDRFTTGGILLPSDDGKSSGIRPRWAEVYAVGAEQHDISPGQWVLVSHGRWTRAVKYEIDGESLLIQLVDNDDILMISDEPQGDDTFSSEVLPDSNIHKNEGSMHNHEGGPNNIYS